MHTIAITERDDRQTCPGAPEIVNAINVKNNSDTMVFVCNNSYTMVDPVTNRHSTGAMKCIRGDWFPYPFPVCKHLNTQSTQASDVLISHNNNTASQDGPQPDVMFAVEFLFLLVLGLILLSTIVIVCVRIKSKKTSFIR